MSNAKVCRWRTLKRRKDMGCGVIEWDKQNNLIWFGLVEVGKKIHESKVKEIRLRGKIAGIVGG